MINSSLARPWLFVAFAAVLSVGCYLKPLVEFDSYEYAAAAGANPRDLGFASEPSPYLKLVLDDPAARETVGTFYRPKVLYWLIARGLWRAGMPIKKALGFIAALAFFGIALVLARWTKGPYWLCAVVMLAPSFVNSGRSLLPDTLTALFAFLGLYLGPFGLPLMVASIWTRPDAIFFAGWAVLYLLWQRRIRWPVALGSLAVFALSLALIIQLSHWSMGRVYYNGLVQHVTINPEAWSSLGIVRYLKALFACTRELASSTTAPFWVLLGVVAWRLPENRPLLLVAALAIAPRLITFQFTEDRYFLASWLVVAACFILTMKDLSCTTASSNPARLAPGVPEKPSSIS